MIQSIFVSEYGLRHLKQAQFCPQHKWGHRLIAAIHFCPVINWLAALIERFIAKRFFPVSLVSLPHQSPVWVVRQEWLFKGTQNGSKEGGKVEIAKTESIRQKLNRQSPPGIRFNRDKIVGNISGGACSAMCLDFLDAFFSIKKASLAQPHVLANRIAQLGNRFADCSKELRNRQVAFNAIEVIKGASHTDYTKSKVQALANFHKFAIDYSSSEIDAYLLSSEKQIEQEINSMPDGAFLLRIIKPLENEKLEEYGHTMVYIREQGLGFLYDPNFGVRVIPSSEQPKIFFQKLKECWRDWEISKARFYRLQPSI
ncbi:MAG TPA: hypothetical protein VGJ00_02720 [Rhabdochlamydiaceae bacterium]